MSHRRSSDRYDSYERRRSDRDRDDRRHSRHDDRSRHDDKGHQAPPSTAGTSYRASVPSVPYTYPAGPPTAGIPPTTWPPHYYPPGYMMQPDGSAYPAPYPATYPGTFPPTAYPTYPGYQQPGGSTPAVDASYDARNYSNIDLPISSTVAADSHTKKTPSTESDQDKQQGVGKSYYDDFDQQFDDYANPVKGSGSKSVKSESHTSTDKIVIYLGNLDKSITNKEMHKLLEGMPGVVDIAVDRQRDPSSSKTCVFLEMSSKHTAEAIVDKFHGFVYNDRSLSARLADSLDFDSVKLAFSASSRSGSSKKATSSTGGKREVQLYIGNIPSSVTPAELLSFLKPYPHRGVRMKKSASNRLSVEFAFMDMEDEDAGRCYRHIRKRTLHRSELACKLVDLWDRASNSQEILSKFAEVKDVGPMFARQTSTMTHTEDAEAGRTQHEDRASERPRSRSRFSSSDAHGEQSPSPPPREDKNSGGEVSSTTPDSLDLSAGGDDLFSRIANYKKRVAQHAKLEEEQKRFDDEVKRAQSQAQREAEDLRDKREAKIRFQEREARKKREQEEREAKRKREEAEREQLQEAEQKKREEKKRRDAEKREEMERLLREERRRKLEEQRKQEEVERKERLEREKREAEKRRAENEERLRRDEERRREDAMKEEMRRNLQEDMKRKRIISKLEEKIKGSEDPMLGLSFVTELQSSSEPDELKYKCSLCNCSCGVDFIIPHITGLQHRTKFLEKYHADEFRHVANIRNLTEKRAKIEHHAKLIEVDIGREEVNVKLLDAPKVAPQPVVTPPQIVKPQTTPIERRPMRYDDVPKSVPHVDRESLQKKTNIDDKTNTKKRRSVSDISHHKSSVQLQKIQKLNDDFQRRKNKILKDIPLQKSNPIEVIDSTRKPEAVVETVKKTSRYNDPPKIDMTAFQKKVTEVHKLFKSQQLDRQLEDEQKPSSSKQMTPVTSSLDREEVQKCFTSQQIDLKLENTPRVRPSSPKKTLDRQDLNLLHEFEDKMFCQPPHLTFDINWRSLSPYLCGQCGFRGTSNILVGSHKWNSGHVYAQIFHNDDLFNLRSAMKKLQFLCSKCGFKGGQFDSIMGHISTKPCHSMNTPVLVGGFLYSGYYTAAVEDLHRQKLEKDLRRTVSRLRASDTPTITEASTYKTAVPYVSTSTTKTELPVGSMTQYGLPVGYPATTATPVMSQTQYAPAVISAPMYVPPVNNPAPYTMPFASTSPYMSTVVNPLQYAMPVASPTQYMPPVVGPVQYSLPFMAAAQYPPPVVNPNVSTPPPPGVGSTQYTIPVVTSTPFVKPVTSVTKPSTPAVATKQSTLTRVTLQSNTPGTTASSTTQAALTKATIVTAATQSALSVDSTTRSAASVADTPVSTTTVAGKKKLTSTKRLTVDERISAFICAFCGLQCLNESEIEQHKKDAGHEDASTMKWVKALAEVSRIEQENGKKQYYCSVCKFSSDFKDLITCHIEKVVPEVHPQATVVERKGSQKSTPRQKQLTKPANDEASEHDDMNNSIQKDLEHKPSELSKKTIDTVTAVEGIIHEADGNDTTSVQMDTLLDAETSTNKSAVTKEPQTSKLPGTSETDMDTQEGTGTAGNDDKKPAECIDTTLTQLKVSDTNTDRDCTRDEKTRALLQKSCVFSVYDWLIVKGAKSMHCKDVESLLDEYPYPLGSNVMPGILRRTYVTGGWRCTDCNKYLSHQKADALRHYRETHQAVAPVNCPTCGDKGGSLCEFKANHKDCAVESDKTWLKYSTDNSPKPRFDDEWKDSESLDFVTTKWLEAMKCFVYETTFKELVEHIVQIDDAVVSKLVKSHDEPVDTSVGKITKSEDDQICGEKSKAQQSDIEMKAGLSGDGDSKMDTEDSKPVVVKQEPDVEMKDVSANSEADDTKTDVENSKCKLESDIEMNTVSTEDEIKKADDRLAEFMDEVQTIMEEKSANDRIAYSEIILADLVKMLKLNSREEDLYRFYKDEVEEKLRAAVDKTFIDNNGKALHGFTDLHRSDGDRISLQSLDVSLCKSVGSVTQCRLCAAIGPSSHWFHAHYRCHAGAQEFHYCPDCGHYEKTECEAAAHRASTGHGESETIPAAIVYTSQDDAAPSVVIPRSVVREAIGATRDEDVDLRLVKKVLVDDIRKWCTVDRVATPAGKSSLWTCTSCRHISPELPVSLRWRHFSLHHNSQAPFMCSRCQFRSIDEAAVVSHRKTSGEIGGMVDKHGQIFPLTFGPQADFLQVSWRKLQSLQCLVCSCGFTTTIRSTMVTHTAAGVGEHKVTDKELGFRDLYKVICGLNTEVTATADVVKAVKQYRAMQWKCNVCSTVKKVEFNSRMDPAPLQRWPIKHFVLRHSPEPPYFCALCGFKAVSRERVREHIYKRNHGSEYEILQGEMVKYPSFNIRRAHVTLEFCGKVPTAPTGTAQKPDEAVSVESDSDDDQEETSIQGNVPDGGKCDLAMPKDWSVKSIIKLQLTRFGEPPKGHVWRCTACGMCTANCQLTLIHYQLYHSRHPPYRCGECEFPGWNLRYMEHHFLTTGHSCSGMKKFADVYLPDFLTEQRDFEPIPVKKADKIGRGMQHTPCNPGDGFKKRSPMQWECRICKQTARKPITDGSQLMNYPFEHHITHSKGPPTCADCGICGANVVHMQKHAARENHRLITDEPVFDGPAPDAVFTLWRDVKRHAKVEDSITLLPETGVCLPTDQTKLAKENVESQVTKVKPMDTDVVSTGKVEIVADINYVENDGKPPKTDAKSNSDIVKTVESVGNGMKSTDKATKLETKEIQSQEKDHKSRKRETVADSTSEESQSGEKESKSEEQYIKSQEKDKSSDKQEKDTKLETEEKDIKSVQKGILMQEEDMELGENYNKSEEQDIKSHEKDKSEQKDNKSTEKDTQSEDDTKSHEKDKLEEKDTKLEEKDITPTEILPVEIDMKSQEEGMKLRENENMPVIKDTKSVEKDTKLAVDIKAHEIDTKTGENDKMLEEKETKLEDGINSCVKDKSEEKDTKAQEQYMELEELDNKSKEKSKSEEKVTRSSETVTKSDDTKSHEEDTKSIAKDTTQEERYIMATEIPSVEKDMKLHEDEMEFGETKTESKQNSRKLEDKNTKSDENVIKSEAMSREKSSKSEEDIKSPQSDTNVDNLDKKIDQKHKQSEGEDIKSEERDPKLAEKDIQTEIKSVVKEIRLQEENMKLHEDEMEFGETKTESKQNSRKSEDKNTKSDENVIKSEAMSREKSSKSEEDIKSPQSDTNVDDLDKKIDQKYKKSEGEDIKSEERDPKLAEKDIQTDIKSVVKEIRLQEEDMKLHEDEMEFGETKTESKQNSRKLEDKNTKSDENVIKSEAMSREKSSKSEEDIKSPQTDTNVDDLDKKIEQKHTKSEGEDIKSEERDHKLAEKDIQTEIKSVVKEIRLQEEDMELGENDKLKVTDTKIEEKDIKSEENIENSGEGKEEAESNQKDNKVQEKDNKSMEEDIIAHEKDKSEEKVAKLEETKSMEIQSVEKNNKSQVEDLENDNEAKEKDTFSKEKGIISEEKESHLEQTDITLQERDVTSEEADMKSDETNPTPEGSQAEETEKESREVDIRLNETVSKLEKDTTSGIKDSKSEEKKIELGEKDTRPEQTESNSEKDLIKPDKKDTMSESKDIKSERGDIKALAKDKSGDIANKSEENDITLIEIPSTPNTTLQEEDIQFRENKSEDGKSEEKVAQPIEIQSVEKDVKMQVDSELAENDYRSKEIYKSDEKDKLREKDMKSEEKCKSEEKEIKSIESQAAEKDIKTHEEDMELGENYNTSEEKDKITSEGKENQSAEKVIKSQSEEKEIKAFEKAAMSEEKATKSENKSLQSIEIKSVEKDTMLQMELGKADYKSEETLSQVKESQSEEKDIPAKETDIMSREEIKYQEDSKPHEKDTKSEEDSKSEEKGMKSGEDTVVVVKETKSDEKSEGSNFKSKEQDVKSEEKAIRSEFRLEGKLLKKDLELKDKDKSENKDETLEAADSKSHIKDKSQEKDTTSREEDMELDEKDGQKDGKENKIISEEKIIKSIEFKSEEKHTLSEEKDTELIKVQSVELQEKDVKSNQKDIQSAEKYTLSEGKESKAEGNKIKSKVKDIKAKENDTKSEEMDVELDAAQSQEIQDQIKELFCLSREFKYKVTPGKPLYFIKDGGLPQDYVWKCTSCGIVLTMDGAISHFRYYHAPFQCTTCGYQAEIEEDVIDHFKAVGHEAVKDDVKVKRTSYVFPFFFGPLADFVPIVRDSSVTLGNMERECRQGEVIKVNRPLSWCCQLCNSEELVPTGLNMSRSDLTGTINYWPILHFVIQHSREAPFMCPCGWKTLDRQHMRVHCMKAGHSYEAVTIGKPTVPNLVGQDPDIVLCLTGDDGMPDIQDKNYLFEEMQHTQCGNEFEEQLQLWHSQDAPLDIKRPKTGMSSKQKAKVLKTAKSQQLIGPQPKPLVNTETHVDPRTKMDPPLEPQANKPTPADSTSKVADQLKLLVNTDDLKPKVGPQLTPQVTTVIRVDPTPDVDPELTPATLVNPKPKVGPKLTSTVKTIEPKLKTSPRPQLTSEVTTVKPKPKVDPQLTPQATAQSSVGPKLKEESEIIVPGKPVNFLPKDFVLLRTFFWKCTLCGIQYNLDTAMSHFRFYHSMYPPFACSMCGFRGREREDIKTHIIMADHPLGVDIVDESKMSNPVMLFGPQPDLVPVHKDQAVLGVMVTDCTPGSVIKEYKPMVWKCNKCDVTKQIQENVFREEHNQKVSRMNSIARRHFLTHNPPDELACNSTSCFFTCNDKSDMAAHRASTKDQHKYFRKQRPTPNLYGEKPDLSLVIVEHEAIASTETKDTAFKAPAPVTSTRTKSTPKPVVKPLLDAVKPGQSTSTAVVQSADSMKAGPSTTVSISKDDNIKDGPSTPISRSSDVKDAPSTGTQISRSGNIKEGPSTLITRANDVKDSPSTVTPISVSSDGVKDGPSSSTSVSTPTTVTRKPEVTYVTGTFIGRTPQVKFVTGTFIKGQVHPFMDAADVPSATSVWTCTTCGMNMPYSRTILHFMHYHNQTARFSCDFCGFRGEIESDVRVHIASAKHSERAEVLWMDVQTYPFFFGPQSDFIPYCGQKKPVLGVQARPCKAGEFIKRYDAMIWLCNLCGLTEKVWQYGIAPKQTSLNELGTWPRQHYVEKHTNTAPFICGSCNYRFYREVDVDEHCLRKGHRKCYIIKGPRSCYAYPVLKDRNSQLDLVLKLEPDLEVKTDAVANTNVGDQVIEISDTETVEVIEIKDDSDAKDIKERLVVDIKDSATKDSIKSIATGKEKDNIPIDVAGKLINKLDVVGSEEANSDEELVIEVKQVTLDDVSEDIPVVFKKYSARSRNIRQHVDDDDDGGDGEADRDNGDVGGKGVKRKAESDDDADCGSGEESDLDLDSYTVLDEIWDDDDTSCGEEPGGESPRVTSEVKRFKSDCESKMSSAKASSDIAVDKAGRHENNESNTNIGDTEICVKVDCKEADAHIVKEDAGSNNPGMDLLDTVIGDAGEVKEKTVLMRKRKFEEGEKIISTKKSKRGADEILVEGSDEGDINMSPGSVSSGPNNTPFSEPKEKRQVSETNATLPLPTNTDDVADSVSPVSTDSPTMEMGAWNIWNIASSSTGEKDSQSEVKDSETKEDDSHIKEEDSRSEVKDSHTKEEDSQSEVKDSRSKANDSRTKEEDSQSEVKDSHAKEEDSQSEVKDSHAKEEDNQTKVEDSRSEIDDTHSEIEDLHFEVKVGHLKVKDGHLEVKDSQSKIEDSHSEIDSSHSEIDDSPSVSSPVRQVYICPDCGKKCKTKGGLTTHKRVHKK